MSFLKFVRILFFTIVFGGLFAACTESECTNVTDPRLRVRFIIQTQRRATTGVIQTIPKDTTIRLVSVTGIGNTSGNYVSQVMEDTASPNILTAYLSQVKDTTGFVIEWDTAGVYANRGANSIFKDTLKVVYHRQTYFVSEGCGFNYRFRDISIINETFTKSVTGQVKTVTVTNPVADEGLQPNITILFNRRTP